MFILSPMFRLDDLVQGLEVKPALVSSGVLRQAVQEIQMESQSW